jgi:hypothetical protein
MTNRMRGFGTLLLCALPLATLAADKSPAKPAPARAVHVNREALDAKQIAALEQAYRVRILDGRYWYDKVSGAWGMENGPALGQVHPALKLGGALRADASGGGHGRLTGVFINGRELHPRDVQALQQITSVVPGRYWVDAQGNGGYQGGPAIFNLYYLAQQARTRGGGSSWYYGNSLTNTYAGSSGGCTYVMGSGAGSGSWSASSGC